MAEKREVAVQEAWRWHLLPGEGLRLLPFMVEGEEEPSGQRSHAERGSKRERRTCQAPFNNQFLGEPTVRSHSCPGERHQGIHGGSAPRIKTRPTGPHLQQWGSDSTEDLVGPNEPHPNHSNDQSIRIETRFHHASQNGLDLLTSPEILVGRHTGSQTQRGAHCRKKMQAAGHGEGNKRRTLREEHTHRNQQAVDQQNDVEFGRGSQRRALATEQPDSRGKPSLLLLPHQLRDTSTQ
ncbi:hypothetical protein AAY473_008008 [Plecturocebus cupreus]